MLDRTHDPELAEIEVDLARRRVECRPVGSQSTFERLHFLPCPLMDDTSELCLRQSPASVQEHRRPLRLDSGLHPVPDIRAKVIAFEAVELERLVVIQREIVELEPYPEPFAEKEAGGVGEEGGQLRKVDTAPGFVRLRQLCSGETSRRLISLPSRQHRLRCFAHTAGIAEQGLSRRIVHRAAGRLDRRGARHFHGGRHEVPRAERLERVKGLDRRAREPAAKVILQLVHQHRRRDRGVVAQTAPGVGHEEAAPGCEEGLQEREPVFVPEVAIAPPDASRRNEIERRSRG